MAHQRQTIRAAVVELLVAADTDAEADVFPTRDVPWAKVDLPGISVYSMQEEVDPSRASLDGGLERTLTLAVVMVVALTSQASVDDALDALAEQVEAAMRADPTLGGTATGSLLRSTEIDLAEEQGRPMGVARLTFDVKYHSAAPA